MVAGLVYRSLGFPPQFFTVLFAIPRVTGYLSHWRESLSDPDTKILRPQQDYRVSTCGQTKMLQSLAANWLLLMICAAVSILKLKVVFDEVLGNVVILPKGSHNVFQA